MSIPSSVSVNLTNVSVIYEPVGGLDYIRHRLPLIVPYLILLSCSTLVGTLGNALLIVALLCSNQLRHVGNYLVLNLGISDLIICFVVNGLAFVGAFDGELFFMQNPILCQAAGSACLITCYCSLFTVTVISLNRYLLICRRNWYNKIFTKNRTIAICILIWIVAVCFHLSNFFNWGSFSFDRKALACITDRRANLSHSIYFGTVGIGMPFVVSTICYSCIYQRVKESKAKSGASTVKGTPNPSASAVNKNRQKQIRGTVMLFLGFLAFFFLWLPFAVLFVVDHWDTLPQWPILFALVIGHINSAVNPVIYGASNKSYRKGYLKVLGFKRAGGATTTMHENPEMPVFSTNVSHGNSASNQ